MVVQCLKRKRECKEIIESGAHVQPDESALGAWQLKVSDRNLGTHLDGRSIYVRGRVLERIYRFPVGRP